jgi:hypothetical protein
LGLRADAPEGMEIRTFAPVRFADEFDEPVVIRDAEFEMEFRRITGHAPRPSTLDLAKREAARGNRGLAALLRRSHVIESEFQSRARR